VAGPGFSGSYRFFRRLAGLSPGGCGLEALALVMAQASILFFSCLAIWALSAGGIAWLRRRPVRATLLDLYRLVNDQWGVFLVSIWFTGKPYPGTLEAPLMRVVYFLAGVMVGGMAA